MSEKLLPKIKSINELKRLANDDGPLQERYQKLAMLAASNLGGFGIKSHVSALRHLNNEADATDESGVVNEINYVRDIEAANA